ncbi:RNA polymerase sigma-70 factor [Parapedobacter indicus]|uniref:RNA polymerase sigma-70 factor, ECF subfamily n=1 Tax=Parapedobacter indicus TaxID=1477437 RepID=A0A1I3U7V7_9SPHI|nr:RNA polymerase sigma-70 factor [Parapedobacter indicus]PPK99153.1 RNA polymerase sigma-70 factor (ECF subfamily) [Parapedobacter indicus]SFJ77936.1 RNA polymerase sigma-70 factor, ECF subfamily [Parapedobacter indicus]
MAISKLVFQDRKNSNWLDERRFNDIFEQYWKKLFGFCRRHIRDPETSKEIVQQLFLSLWERRAVLDINVNIGHYLFSAARLKIAEHYRRQATRSAYHGCAADFCDFTTVTEDTVHYQDLDCYVKGLLERLPCRCRQVYTLSRNSGLTIPEIAQQLEISPKTAEAHLTKALKFLRAALLTGDR